MVMPRSRSRSFESMTRSATASLARNVPLWRNIASTRVVLPWSTWAMMAMLKIGFGAGRSRGTAVSAAGAGMGTAGVGMAAAGVGVGVGSTPGGVGGVWALVWGVLQEVGRASW